MAKPAAVATSIEDVRKILADTYRRATGRELPPERLEAALAQLMAVLTTNAQFFAMLMAGVDGLANSRDMVREMILGTYHQLTGREIAGEPLEAAVAEAVTRLQAQQAELQKSMLEQQQSVMRLHEEFVRSQQSAFGVIHAYCTSLAARLAKRQFGSGDAQGAPDEARAKPAGQQHRVVLQARAGAVGGNPCRIDMAAIHTPYIQDITAEPIPFNAAVDMFEPAKAYAEGGPIPQGKTLVIRKIAYRGVAKGDSNGPGRLVVVAGGTGIVSRSGSADPVSGTWEGEIAVKPGQEDSVYLEVSNSSAGEAVMDGVFR